MKEIFSMSETEEQIMDLFWNRGTEFRLSAVLSYFNQEVHKEWAKQTMHTFLTRLLEKGLLSATGGPIKTYRAAMTRSEYEQKKAQSILDGIYDGEIKNFVAALSGGMPLKKKEADELRAFMKQ